MGMRSNNVPYRKQIQSPSSIHSAKTGRSTDDLEFSEIGSAVLTNITTRETWFEARDEVEAGLMEHSIPIYFFNFFRKSTCKSLRLRLLVAKFLGPQISV